MEIQGNVDISEIFEKINHGTKKSLPFFFVYMTVTRTKLTNVSLDIVWLFFIDPFLVFSLHCYDLIEFAAWSSH